MEAMKNSLVIPVYKNEGSIPQLLGVLTELFEELDRDLEVVFVVDGSPDRSFELLQEALPKLAFPSKLLVHSRNFGSFPATYSGLRAASGEYCAVMAADLQEPWQLYAKFFRRLAEGETDVIVGSRASRQDPLLSRLSSHLFWGLYRRWVVKDMPSGGVDTFACTKEFCDKLISLKESRSSLVALVFWLGYRREFFEYHRSEREHGKSAWTLRKKVDYMLDSIFAFSDLPIRLLLGVGLVGSLVSLIFGALVLAAVTLHGVIVPGYATTILTVLFFGMLNLLALGVVGSYSWRGYENTKRRPHAVVARALVFQPGAHP